jgi:hypothetical protein
MALVFVKRGEFFSAASLSAASITVSSAAFGNAVVVRSSNASSEQSQDSGGDGKLYPVHLPSQTPSVIRIVKASAHAPGTA